MTALARTHDTGYEGVWQTLVARRAACPNPIRRSFAARASCLPGRKNQFVLDAHCGSVRIRAADTDRVQANVEILHGDGQSAASPQIDFDEQNGTVAMRSRGAGLRAWLSAHGRLRLRFDVTVPREFHVQISTRGGSVEVEGVQGSVSVQTAGGWLSFRDLGGPLRATTSGGGIDVDGCRGNIRLKTAGGPIEVLRAAGSVDARTAGGGIEVHFERAPRGRLKTSGGDLDVWFATAEGAQLDARAGGGWVEAESVANAVAVDNRAGGKHREGDTRCSHVRTSLNGGGAPLLLRTRGGSIRLREARPIAATG